MESMDKGVWDVVVNGHFQPTKTENGKTIPKEFSTWTLDEIKRAYYDLFVVHGVDEPQILKNDVNEVVGYLLKITQISLIQELEMCFFLFKNRTKGYDKYDKYKRNYHISKCHFS